MNFMRTISSGFLLSFICLVATIAPAQKQPPVSWQKALGGSGNDRGVSVATHAPFSGFTICGTTNSSNGDVTVNHGDDDIWVVKLSHEGALLWEKTYGDGLSDIAAHIVATPDGGYIVGGSTRPIYAPPTDTNHLQWWIFKIDSVGTMLWEKKYGGSAPDNLTWLDIAEDSSIYCVGHSASNDRDFPVNKGNYDIWVMKLNATGDLIWKKPFAGSSEDRGYMVRATADGGCVIAGKTASTDGDMTENTTGSTDGFVAKLSASGDVSWKKVYGTAAAEFFNALTPLRNGGYLVVGITHGAGEPNGDFHIVRLDAAGAIVWEKFYGGSGRDEATAVFEVGTSGYHVMGTSTSVIDSIPTHRGLSDWLVYRIDTSGNNGSNLFSRWFGGAGEDKSGSNILFAFPGYISVGTSNSNDQYVTGNHGNSDVYVVKYGGGDGLNVTPPFVDFDTVATGSSITRDVVVNNFAGEIITATARLAGSSGGKYSIQGANIPFALGPYEDTTLTITYSPTEVSSHVDTLYVDGDIGQAMRVTLRGVGSLTGSVDNELLFQPLSLYPNPAHDKVTIALPGQNGSYIATIEDLNGVELKKFVLEDTSGQFSILDFPAGMYVLTLYQNNQIAARTKFVKE